jgi:hypothetical protein
MNDSSLALLRTARVTFGAWIEATSKSPDPAAQGPEIIRQLSVLVQQVNGALREVPSSLAASDEWRAEVAAYRDTLRALHDRLSRLETALRIRRQQMVRMRAHLGAARSWAELARHIG